ncbi:MAG: glycosyltransferase [Verrucomicrobiaceae bacterium]|nr:glycosyltransferase [Verrucomicrobiaceae bacterium]
MPEDESAPEAADNRPHVISLCGTYLKPEMQSIYRQITGLQRVRTTVYAQWLENEGMFPFPHIRLLTKQHHRPRGNFLLRFWYKHVIKKWPPPRAISKFIGPCHPWDLVERLEEDRPDLVHVYYGHKAAGFLPMLRDWGGPWVVSFHGVDVAKHMEEKDYLKKLQDVFAEARLVMARSHSLLQQLADLGCPVDKLRLNRTPIPMDHLEAVAHEAPPDGHWRLVQACRLIPKKGLLTTLDAMDSVATLLPGAKYIICGDGPMLDQLRQFVAEKSLHRHVEFRGWLTQEQLVHEYHQAHVFLHASEQTPDNDQEGIPNSMLEAMATGLPVIATHHGGIPEAVTDGSDGLLVPERDSGAVTNAIMKLAHDHALYAQMSVNAAASVRENFGAEQQIANLENIYLEAMGELEPAPEEAAA